MPPRSSRPIGWSRNLDEDLFVSADEKSLNRGRRKAPRTAVCRPCLIWNKAAPDDRIRAVMLDLNPYGMRVRMIDPLPPGTEVTLVLMRDDEFIIPLSQPLNARIVRTIESDDGFVDVGVQVIWPKLRPRSVEQTPRRSFKLAPRPGGATRMHTADFTQRNRGGGR